MIYAISRWDAEFESYESRKIEKLTWFRFPTRLDSDGYCEIMMHPNGVAHYGVWCAILAVATRGTPRGVLIRKTGQPHTPETIALIARMPLAIVAEAWEQFVQIGWLVDATSTFQDRNQPGFESGSENRVDQVSKTGSNSAFLEREEEKERGERACAREPGATAPEPPPLSSASPSPEPETEPERNSAPTPPADIAATVETEWKAAAASVGKPPGKASRSDRRIVADAIPDATHRAAIFAAVFAEPSPKAFNLVVLDLAAWSDRVKAKATKAEAVRGVAVNYESLPGPPEKTAEERAAIRRQLGLGDSAPDPPSTKSRAEQLAALKA